MGKRTASSEDDVLRKTEATITANGQATPWQEFSGRFNLHLAGTFVATVILERSFDGGATAAPCTRLGAAFSFTGPASEALPDAAEIGVLYRLRCVAFTSGSILARLSQ
ncbi:MAG: hypothetical protein ACK5SX_15085 [Sandaracinobacter sp.]